MAMMNTQNRDQKIVDTIKQLFAKASSTVLVQGIVGDWSYASIGIHQGFLLSLTLLNILLERLMTNVLEEYHDTVSIGGQVISNLRFTDGLAGEEQELANLVNHLHKTSSRYGMEISAEKTKLMTNSTKSIYKKITVSRQPLKIVNQFKYRGAILSEGGSKTEILGRAAQTTAALENIKPTWRDKNIRRCSKLKLQNALVLSIFLYA